MLINQSIVQLVLKNLKLKVKPHRTDFTPNQSSLAQNLKPKKKLHTSCLSTSQSPNIHRLSTDSPFYTHRKYCRPVSYNSWLSMFITFTRIGSFPEARNWSIKGSKQARLFTLSCEILSEVHLRLFAQGITFLMKISYFKWLFTL